ncbi:hypothetical protein ACP70R_006628 [Stipagrostis hirtigluma subsp. patula]
MERLHHSGPSGVTPKFMSLVSLKEMTNNFSEERKLGSGTFGKVYKGLVDMDGKIVHADNIHRALCFEYMQNGSLREHLHDEQEGLDWQTRYNIIKGTWEGLKYLHEGLDTPIYHLDLKPDNILLDKNMVPKLADFGLSRLVYNDQTQATKSNIGTIGYLPPEYIDRKLISKKLDVFSLGVVMIQIISGHKGYQKSGDMSRQEFIDLVHANWRNRLQTTPECRFLDGECHQVKRCIEIALDCVNAERKERPKIRDIIRWLNETESLIQKTASSSVSSLDDEFQSVAVSASPFRLQRPIGVPTGPGEASTEIRSQRCSETSNLLDVYPLEVRFPFEPDKRIRCPVSLTNRTNYYVGAWITLACTDDASLDLCFPGSWDPESSDEEDEPSDEEDPRPHCFQIMKPHSTWVVAMTMMEQHEQPQPPQDTAKFEVVMIAMESEQVLKNLQPSIANKLNMDSEFLKRLEELGGDVYSAMLTTIICDPASCQAPVTQHIMSTLDHGDPYSMDADSTNSWVLCAHDEGYVCIWDYQKQEKVEALQVVKKDTFVSAAKFITRKEWFAAGDDQGWIHVYSYTTMRKVKKFKAYRGKPVSALAVHPTYPFLLSSSDEDHSSIKLWDWDQSWACIGTFDGHTKAVLRLMFNPTDLNTFLSVSDDNTAKVWNIHSTNPITTLTSMDAYGTDYFFTDSRRPLLVTSDRKGGNACIWDLQAKELVHKLSVCDAVIDHVACHPTLPILATTLWSKIICLWDANTYRLEKMVSLPHRTVEDLVFVGTKDLTRLVVGLEEEIRIIEVNIPAVTTDE